MDHVAIMNKKLGLIDRILAGKKIIETRWTKNKIAPYNKISLGDKIYFKDSGSLVRAIAEVSQFKQYENLSLNLAKELIDQFGTQIDVQNKNDYAWAKGKNYAILIWLKNPRPITPFSINKAGFGTGSAWLTVENIDIIRMH